MKIDEVYPLTVVLDRYNGTYSKGKYTAWNMTPDMLPEEIECSDIECMDFWDSYSGDVGKGDSPDKAMYNLLENINKKEH